MAKKPSKTRKYVDMRYIMSPKSVAIIGASEKAGKVGNAIMQNYIDVGFQGRIYPININAEGSIMGYKAYRSILDVKRSIDLVVISVPAKAVPGVMEECGKAGVKGIIIVSGGFAEVGEVELQKRVYDIAQKYNIPVLGPNCLGVMDTRSRNDTLFLPTFKIDRPKIGGVSFVSQSGSVGSSTLDLISGEGFGLARFISYGNAVVIDEVDLLNYLAHDKYTKVIVFYIEGVKRGREFIELAKKVTRLKPVVILKGGVTELGASAAHSHTASLAGSAQAYEAVFRQYGFIEAKNLEELLYFAKVFDTQPPSRGNRVAVITNGGGHGVLATDALYLNGLVLPDITAESKERLRKTMPKIVNIKMPLDIGGDAGEERFSAALDILEDDPNIDSIMSITLFQTPGADEKVADAIIRHGTARKKPLVVVSTGSTYTKSHTSIIEGAGVPVYDSPDSAARALAALLWYSNYKNKVVE